MQPDDLIIKINALELLLDEGRQKLYSIKEDLARFYVPAPLVNIAEDKESTQVIIRALDKRKSQFYKKNQKK